jgi:hypothetical protein
LGWELSSAVVNTNHHFDWSFRDHGASTRSPEFAALFPTDRALRSLRSSGSDDQCLCEPFDGLSTAVRVRAPCALQRTRHSEIRRESGVPRASLGFWGIPFFVFDLLVPRFSSFPRSKKRLLSTRSPLVDSHVVAALYNNTHVGHSLISNDRRNSEGRHPRY